LKRTKKSKIEWALGVLGLSEPVRETDVIDAMNRITQSWEDNLQPEAWEAKRNAQEAGGILLRMIEAEELAKADQEPTDPLLYFVSEEAAKKARENEQKRNKRIILGGGLALVLILAFAIPSAIAGRRERMIDSVFLLRSTMDSNTVKVMENYLDRLEGEPRVESVRAEFELIRDDIEIWLSRDLSSTPAERREAYYRLLAFDEARPAWYLMGFLDLQGDLVPLIRDSRFEGEGMYFELTIHVDDTWDLETNLPASYDSFKPYLLQITPNGKDYRLVHEQSALDVVQLYRIQSVTQTQLTIYAYATERTYVLNRIGS
jgi:hypothetical protein